ncbi:unnamed protein product [Rotaria magnacalcarata]|uniref:Uncharacterized protein n=1 Tax=Rotaria magnacalcarata TaxID=392030 RepID=A0A814YRD7_9BILA|nr:unnamed protein product [Rotaria magnacalcarata]CAF1602832.1 unnamed protein product [Rotaria magnacalcarata]
MTNNIDSNTEKSPLLGHQLLTDENNSVRHILQNEEEKPYLSYFKLSPDDNRNINLTNFQDPFFYEQPLDFNYHRSMATVIRSENEIGFDKYYKENSLSSHRNGIERSESPYRKHMKSMKTNQKIIKRSEIKKKRSVESVKQKKRKNKNPHGNYFKQYEHEAIFSKAKNRQPLLIKHHFQQELLSKRKKKLSKQHILSKKTSILKRNTSRTNNQRNSSRKSWTSTFKRSRSLTQSKTGKKRSKKASRSNTNRVLSDSHKISNTVKDETSLLALNPDLRLNNHQMMGIPTVPKHRNDRNNVKFIEMKTSPSLSTLKNSLIENISSTSTIMPFAKDNVQLTSKINNRRASKIKHTRNILGSTRSERRLMTATGTGMILRSKTILRNELNAIQLKN